MPKKVLVLDGGAQYEGAIIQKIIKLGYDAIKQSINTPFNKIDDNCDAIIISGGPRSVYDTKTMLPAPEIYYSKIPILGICLGAQSIAHQIGGKVERGKKGEYGRTYIDITKKEPIFKGLNDKERVLMSHFDVISEVPDGFETYATSGNIIAALGNEDAKIYGTQFHPEMTPVTKKGNEIFRNFFLNVCGFPETKKRSVEDEIRQIKKYIRETVGDKHVLWQLSGGVDSTVGVALSSDVIEPEKLHVRYLDTGVMRKGETKEVIGLAENMNLSDFKVLNVANNFYVPLCRVIDPKEKRKVFKDVYREIAKSEIAKIAAKNHISDDDFLLGQGTLRPDLIESGSKQATMGDAHNIKDHHNTDLGIPPIEPFTMLFKEDMRAIAKECNLPNAYRQPSPGPSLYVRILNSDGRFMITPEFENISENVNTLANEYGFNGIVLPFQTVGVQGDERSYKHAALLTGIPDWDNYLSASLRIPNEINSINRVMFSLGTSPSIEDVCSLTATYNDNEAINQVRECDYLMRLIAEKYGFNDSRNCSQMPGFLTPVNFGIPEKRSYTIRPVRTDDFLALIGMTPHKNFKNIHIEDRREHIPEEMFYEMANTIPRKVGGIARILWDFTDKPPGTTEAQ